MSVSQPEAGGRPAAAAQSETPYLDALRAFAERDPGRLHVPGHKGGTGADPRLIEAVGERARARALPARGGGRGGGGAPPPSHQPPRRPPPSTSPR